MDWCWSVGGIAALCFAACSGDRSRDGGDATGGRAGDPGSGGGGATSSGTSSGGDAPAGGASGSGYGGSPAAGSGGASGTSGAAGEAGGDSGGATSTGGAGGAGGTGGTGGSVAVPGCKAGTQGGAPDVCRFDIACALSAAIPTVGVIDWSTDLAGLDAARIEFTLNDPAPDEINRGSGGEIDVSGTTHRALMLGLKPERSYTYRIVASAGSTTCTSPDHTLTTGAATGAPVISRTVEDAAARARGFIVTSSGYPFQFGQDHGMAFIADADGAVVWWAPAPPRCSRALMDWEGTSVWMLATNPGAGGEGEVRRVAMDGTPDDDDLEVLARAHHDFTVVPGGIVALLRWHDDGTGSDLVERSPDGSVETVVELGTSIWLGTGTGGTLFHANSLEYHASDDTYTVGDRDTQGYVKLTRQGELLWHFGRNCSNAVTSKCASGDFFGNHGHHLRDDGTIAVFSAILTGSSTAEVYRLAETTDSLTASKLSTYSVPDLRSAVLGDVQLLPNDNLLVVYSTAGRIHEVSATGELVQILVAKTPEGGDAPFGYANFRETLYGPPSR